MRIKGKIDSRGVKGWEKHFDRALLTAGRALIKGGACYMHPLSGYEESVTVKVSDEEKNTVDILFPVSGVRNTECFCTCQRARGGRQCAHIAAALYYYFQKRDALLPKERSRPRRARARDRTDSLREGAETAAVRRKLMVLNRKPALSFEAYQKRADAVVRCCVENGLPNTVQARELEKQLMIQFAAAAGMAERGEAENAVAFTVLLCEYIEKKGDEFYLDALKLYGKAEAVLCRATENKSLHKRVFPAVMRQFYKTEFEPIRDLLSDTLFTRFCYEPFWKQLLAFSRRESEKRAGDEKWEWIQREILVRKAMGCGFSAVEQICLENLDLRGACARLSSRYKAVRDYPKLIALYEKMLTVPGKSESELCEIHEQLAECFRCPFDREKYLSHLWIIVRKYHRFYPLDSLRAQYSPGEWEELCRQTVEECPKDYRLNLLEDLGYYDRLWEELRDRSFATKRFYERSLMEHCPAEYLRCFEEYCRGLAEKAVHLTGVKRCLNAVSDLRDLSGGQAAADGLVAEWKKRYAGCGLFMHYLAQEGGEE